MTIENKRAPFLHVANGTSVTGMFEAAGIPGATSIWADPLHDGPVPGGLTDDELIDVRTRYLAPSDGAADPANNMREWRAVIARTDRYDELVLWFEHDLFDQLNLVQLLAWISARRGFEKPVSLICIGSFPGHPNFKGLGELQPAEIATLLDTRTPVTPAQYELASRAWEAFRQPSPIALDDVRRADASALPFLSAALERFLQEYPWMSDGLSRTERRLMQVAADGGIALASAYPRMHDGERAYYVTGSSVVSVAASLEAASLLTWSAADDSARSHLQGSVALTDTGRAVLDGTRDRVEACGIDRWLGGVHLQGRSVRWRWDDVQRAIVSS